MSPYPNHPGKVRGLKWKEPKAPISKTSWFCCYSKGWLWYNQNQTRFHSTLHWPTILISVPSFLLLLSSTLGLEWKGLAHSLPPNNLFPFAPSTERAQNQKRESEVLYTCKKITTCVALAPAFHLPHWLSPPVPWRAGFPWTLRALQIQVPPIP